MARTPVATQAFSVVVRVRQNRAKQIGAAFVAAIGPIMGKAAFDTQRLIQQTIVARGIVDTGRYLNSWQTAQLSPFSWRVFSDVEYGPYQEYGTRNMAARPHVVPSADRAAKALEQAFTKLERAI